MVLQGIIKEFPRHFMVLMFLLKSLPLKKKLKANETTGDIVLVN